LLDLADASAVQLVTDKMNTADLSGGVFAILITVTRTLKIKKSLPFHKFRQKLANSDITKEALNCTESIAADSIVNAISFIRHIIL